MKDLRTGDGATVGNNDVQRIFISYRRSDCQSQANGLYDGLKHRLGSAKIFMDLETIPPGVDFEEHIRNEIAQCDVVLVLIGDEWLETRPDESVRRIDEPGDFVRLEIESSLGLEGVRVIPVLVEGARMPLASELPAKIHRLARLNAFELSDSRWGSDLERLAGELRSLQRGPAQVPARASVSLADLRHDAVRHVVAAMPASFTTKDVSTHPVMHSAHGGLVAADNYHAMVGTYLSRQSSVLRLVSAPARDDRGAIWTKAAPPAPAQQRPPMGPPSLQPQHPWHATPDPRFAPQSPQAGPPRHAPPLPQAGYPGPGAAGQGAKIVSHGLMPAIPLVTCGLGAWAPPLYSGLLRKGDAAFRRNMFLLAGGLVILLIIAFVLLATAPTDASGTPVGVASNVGAALVLAVMAGGTATAVMTRNNATSLAGTAQELQRRDQRARYRKLVQSDHALAASIRVGRPDLPRDYDDGGLLDVNTLPQEALRNFGDLTPDEAARIISARDQLGRFAGFNELHAYVDLPEGTHARLREVAVFL